MYLEIHKNNQILWRGWYPEAAMLRDIGAPEDTLWTLTVRPRLDTPRRFPARAALLIATAFSRLRDQGLPWTGEFLTPEGTPDDGSYRQKLIDRLNFHLWKTLPVVYQFQFQGPQAWEACYLSAILMAQSDSSHPHRLPDMGELERALESFPLKSGLRPLLASLNHLSQTGVLGFRRIGRPRTSTPDLKRELNRLRQARWRARQKKHHDQTGI